MSELNGGIPIEVDPTIELHARVEMGGTASEYNAEAWAVGERGGVPVSSTDQTYHNNSKYYAEQAAEDVQEVNNASAKIDNMTVEGNTGAPGSSVAVAITEVSGHKHIAFTIPQGAKGDTGSKGDTGDTGTGIASAVLNQDYTLTINFDDGTSYTTPNSIRGVTGETPNMVIGTVSTLLPGQQAYVTLDPSSTAERPVLNIGIPKGDTGTMENTYGNTIEMTPYDSTKISEAIDGKTDKVANATSGNFAGLDANGNLTDSGHKHSDYLTQHQDISGKADKVSSAVSGNFAGLDANGNLTDSGSKASDFVDADDFNATEMPMAATDDTTVADVINWNPDVMLDAILGITNVRDAKIFWNRAGSTAGNVGAGKLAVLVESGSAQSIAEAIHTYNTTGLETEGTVSKTVEGDTVYFSRPTAKTVSFSIALKGYTAPDLTTLGPAIQSAVMAYVNGLTIGEDLDCQKLHNVIKQAAGSSAGSFEIADLSCSGTHGVSRGIIPAGWNGIFKVAASTDVTVTASATEESQAIANKVSKDNMVYGTYTYDSLTSMQNGLTTIASTIGARASVLLYVYPNFGETFGGAPGWASITTGTNVQYFSVLFYNYSGVFYGKYLNGTWTWQELVTKSELFAAFKVVAVRKYIIDSGTLSAGSNGYIDVSLTIPSGYKTMGAASVLLAHPGNAGGLQVVCGVEHSMTGTITLSASYYTPKNITASSTDFVISVPCIKSDYSLAVT